MATTVQILTATGDLRFETEIFNGSKRSYTLMGDDYIMLKFNVATPVAFALGDYTILPGIGRFDILDLPKPKYNSETGGYEYELKMEAYYKKWSKKLFRFAPSVGAQEASWSLTGFLYQHLELICANLKALGFRYYGDDSEFVFKILDDVENEAKSMTYADVSIYDALSNMAKEWDTEFWIEDNCIYFGKCYDQNSSNELDLAQDKNVASISPSSSNSDYATRLYVFGSTRNIPKNYHRTLYFQNSNTDEDRDIYDYQRPIDNTLFLTGTDLNKLTITMLGDSKITDQNNKTFTEISGCVFNPDGMAGTNKPIRLPYGYKMSANAKYVVSGLDETKVPRYYFSPEYDSDAITEAVSEQRLMLPGDKAYIDAKENQTADESIEKVITFEEVYPRMRLHVTDVQVLTSVASDDEGKHTEFFYRVKDSSFHFSDDWRTDGETLHIVFETGLLAGMDFEAHFNPDGLYEKNTDGSWNEDAQWIEITANETYGRKLPDTILCPSTDTINEEANEANGDRFVIYGWDASYMADTGLVETAEEELLEKGTKYMNESKIDPTTYTCNMMSDFMKDECATDDTYLFPYYVGKKVNLYSDAYFPTEGVRESRIMGFEYPLDIPYDNASITVGDKPKYSRYGELKTTVKELSIRMASSAQSSDGGTSVYVIKTGDPTPPTDTNVYSALRTGKSYLSKVASDRTPYALSVGGMLRAESGIESEKYQSGMNGYGWGTDTQGNFGVESITVRSYMRLMELIVNRQRIEDADSILTEGDTIESVSELEATSTGQRRFSLKLREEWDGYQTAQIVGNILRGVYNDITNKISGTGTTTINNATYATSWLLVTKATPSTNTIEVTMYPDSECPAGINFAPMALMKVARWGNTTAEDRQRLILFSSTEGRILMRYHVTKPIVDDTNTAVCIGNVPEFLVNPDNNVLTGDQVLYAQKLLVESLVKVDHSGNPDPTLRYRGTYDPDEVYYDGTKLREETQDFERSYVSYLGCLWLCSSASTKDSSGLVVNTAPTWNGTAWALYSSSNALSVVLDRTSTVINYTNPEDTPLSLSARAYKAQEDVTSASGIKWQWFIVSENGIIEDTSQSGAKFETSKAYDIYDVMSNSNGYPVSLFIRAQATLGDEVVYSDHSLVFVCNGEEGNPGTSVTITSTTIEYASSSSGTTAPTSGWSSTSIPNVSAGKYLWTRTTVKYSDGNSTVTYSVSRMGANGTNGTNLTISSTAVTYAVTTDSTQPDDSEFTNTDVPSLSLGDYLWSRTEVVYSDKTTLVSYAVSRIGNDGDNGKSIHIAYANSADGKTNFSTTYFTDALYIGTCLSDDEADPTDYTLYTWARLKGETGATGTAGASYSPNLLTNMKAPDIKWTGKNNAENPTASNAEGFTEFLVEKSSISDYYAPFAQYLDRKTLIDTFIEGKTYTLSFEYKSNVTLNVFADVGNKIRPFSSTNFAASDDWKVGKITQKFNGWGSYIDDDGNLTISGLYLHWYPPTGALDSVDKAIYSFRKICICEGNSDVWTPAASEMIGASGNWTSYVFKASETQPDAPTGTASLPSGWSDAPTSTGRWWMSKATISGSTNLVVGSWSTPVQVTAEDGKDGAYTDFKYQKTTTTTAPSVSSSSVNPGSSWEDAPQSLSSGEYLWMIQAEINADGTLKSNWSTPVRINGEKGDKGDKGATGASGTDGSSYSPNLLLGTKDTPIEGWNSNTTATRTYEINSEGFVEQTFKSTTNSHYCYIGSRLIRGAVDTFIEGKTYTLSFEYKSNIGVNTQIEQQSKGVQIFNSRTFEAVDEWTRVSTTQTITYNGNTPTNLAFTMRFKLNATLDENSYLSFRKVCVCEGTSAEWTPAASEMIGTKGEDGKDGKDASIYHVTLSPATIYVSADGSVDTSATSISVTATKDGNTISTSSDQSLYQLTIIGYNSLDGATTTLSGTLKPSDIATRFSAVVYRLQTKTIPITTLAEATLIINRQGATGATGPYVPSPRLYTDYPDDYVFLDGSTNITVDGTTYKGGTRKDVILIKTISGTETKMCPWTCIKSHKHDSSLTTTSQTWSNYWSADGGYWTQIATQVLLAKDAYIDLISSQGIRIYNDDGDIVGALSDASTKFQGVDILLPFWLNGILDASTGAFDTNPKFGIGADGTIYSGGISTGARIIIDPENKNILVKGTDGTNLVCIDGKKHSISDIISGLSENLTQQSALSSDDITSNTTVELGSVTMPSESGSYKVSMNTSLNTVTVTYIQSVISSSTVGGSSTNVYAQIVSSITATLIAYTKSGTTETIIDSVSVTASGAKSSSVTTTGATLYQANNRLELTLDSVTAQQKYYFRVEYVITHSSAKSSVTGSTYSTSSYSTFAKNYAIDYNKFTPLNEGVVSYLMGNGLLLGSSTNNYLSSGIENGKYVTKAISDGYGLQVTPNGLQIAIGGNSHWQAMPITLVAGKLDMRNCTWVVNSAHCCISATATEPTLEHYKDGDELSSVEIKNISALAGLTSSTFDERNVVVQATLAEPYDVSSVQPATVIARYDANRDSVIVACYDINYIKTTYTNIYIEVKYYPNVIR